MLLQLLHRIRTALSTALHLGCPRCGQRTLFRTAFTMHERCAACGLVFEREPGYWIGAIYINYAATTVLSVAGFLVLDAYTELSLRVQLAIWSAFVTAFPMWFFRYSKSLWLAVDHFLDPDDASTRPFRRHRV